MFLNVTNLSSENMNMSLLGAAVGVVVVVVDVTTGSVGGVEAVFFRIRVNLSSLILIR